ncbi:MAG TPA: hypothetical protein PKW75_04550, partial [candidate division Zixibacteria bacterium]|nr:hypothetical protein [candidate division Zixibacteria bacterium]
MPSVNERFKADLLALVEAPLAAEGAYVADLVVATFKKSATVRVFVCSERGTTLEECARLSRIVGDVLDGTDWFDYGYTLEVSSPGLDRPLVTPRDFRFRTGETVRVEFRDPARKKLTAELVAATDTDVE